MRGRCPKIQVGKGEGNMVLSMVQMDYIGQMDWREKRSIPTCLYGFVEKPEICRNTGGRGSIGKPTFGMKYQ